MRARQWILIAVAAGAAAALAIPGRLGLACRLLAGWNATALALNAVMWSMILRSDAEQTARDCTVNDLGRRIGWLVIATSGVSLFATATLLRETEVLSPHAPHLFTGFCLVAIGNAWILTHTAYTFRYAHLYYDETRHGLVFPGDQPPAYFDFAYFSGTIAMTFQVSDVQITSTEVRCAVLAHAVLAFASTTAILATAVNLMQGALR